ncbi:hypothetical protein [Labrenzia sp. VG12]|uniref:WapI family immunity protein n=1 Tax=Labrenzia sp. VG12 TaxID=2021862 RepID=UPI000B8C0DDF|nr:hypothetical protein [Labrenzia sp. VG12]ASP34347.1 hypothetical protein CHH27_14745 [Labrenzia sp. VG12]
MNMLKFGNETDWVSLTVVDYQFGAAEDAFDRNWLLLEATRSVDGNTRVLRDLALLTWELRDMKRFFQVPETRTRLEFLEPCVAFSRQGETVLLHLDSGLSFDKDGNAMSFETRMDRTWGERTLCAIEDLCRRFPDR